MTTDAKQRRKALLEKVSGKGSEPKFEGLIYSQIDLVRALNHYASHARPDKLRDYALKWLHTHNHKELEKEIRSLPGYHFTTYGALARLESRGFDHGEELRGRMLEYFESLRKFVTRTPAPKKKTAAPPKPNKTLEALDATQDDVLLGRNPTFAIVDVTDNMNQVEEYVQVQLGYLQESPDAYLKGHVRGLTKLFNDALKAIAKIRASKKRAPIVRRIAPTKIVERVKYQREDKVLGLKSINPIDVLGRRKMYVYDTKRRRFSIIESTGPGFTFVGRSVRNIDLEKSVWKTVRKPEDLFQKGKNMSTTELNNAFKELTTKEQKLTSGLFNENHIIVHVTGKV